MLVQAHFVLTYLVPARAGGGWLGWPWAAGDSGVLGRSGETAGGSPTLGVWIAGLAGIAFVVAALATVGIWIPTAWWRLVRRWAGRWTTAGAWRPVTTPERS